MDLNPNWSSRDVHRNQAEDCLTHPESQANEENKIPEDVQDSPIAYNPEIIT